MRTVECVNVTNRTRDMNGNVQLTTDVLPDSNCSSDSRPDAIRFCNTHKCFFQWRVGKYGPVSCTQYYMILVNNMAHLY